MTEEKDITTYCPTSDFTCPYYETGFCMLTNAEEECDDYYAAVGDK